MFDSNILYYSYNNVEGDDFAVGYLGNKEYWVHLMNSWNRNDGRKDRYHPEDFDEFDTIFDLRGCVLAEIVPDHEDYVIFWANDTEEYEIRMDKDGKFSWESGDTLPAVPRWVSSLKNRLKDRYN
jgi:hypothetical protein